MEATLNELKVKMEKALSAFKTELGHIRTGRASLAILDEVRVEYYGTQVPLQQVATLNIPEARLITISPWDQKLIPEIEKAILKSGTGLNPANDGKLIRVPLPSLSEERRKDLVKLVKKHAEECRVGIRAIRRDANEVLKKKKDSKEISEDEEKRGLERVQKMTDEMTAKVEQVLEHKEKDILTV